MVASIVNHIPFIPVNFFVLISLCLLHTASFLLTLLSSSIILKIRLCRMAQLAAHLTLDQGVLGSNPSPAANILLLSPCFSDDTRAFYLALPLGNYSAPAN